MFLGLRSSSELLISKHEEKTFSCFIWFWLIFSCFSPTLSDNSTIVDYYNYNIGTLWTPFCPEGWIQIATFCFKIGTDFRGGILPVKFDESNILCSDNLNHSRALWIPNWFMTTTLASHLYPQMMNQTDISKGARLTEVWTSYYFDVEKNSSTVPNKIRIANSQDDLTAYLALWARNEPSFNNKKSFCVAFDADVAQTDFYGWRVKDCEIKLPVVCQTFTCIKEKEKRCLDNSRCYPIKAECDGIDDCTDSSDEKNCSNLASTSPLVFQEPFGGFTISPGRCILARPCEWHIIQPPGTLITINIINSMKSPPGELILEGMTTGKKILVTNNGSSFYSFGDNKVKVLFRTSFDANFKNGHGFELRYSTEGTTSCFNKLESQDGFFTVPKQLDNQDKYRKGLNCQWTIVRNSNSLVSVVITDYSLAQDDWLKIYESNENEGSRLIGFFDDKKSPPTTFPVAMPNLVFEFHSESDSTGGQGFNVRFQQTCINIYLTETHGRIESPELWLEEHRTVYHCSWVIEPACDNDDCGITFYFDFLNLTDKDLITIQSGADEIRITSDLLPVLSHRTTKKPVILQMFGNTPYFAAQISYSVDCPILQLDKDEFIVHDSNIPNFYRSTVEISCKSYSESVKSLRCGEGGVWSDAPPECAFTKCIFPNISNGEIINITLPTESLPEQSFYFRCNLGFTPDIQKAVCSQGRWIPPDTCLPINCSQIENYYFSANAKDDGMQNATLQLETESTFMSRASYACDDTVYSLRGNPIRYCQTNGTWYQPPILYCKKKQCEQETVEDGFMSPSYGYVGNVSKINCFPGFTYDDSNNQVTCMLNKTSTFWSPSVKACSGSGSSCNSNTCGPGTCEPVANQYYCKCHQGFKQTGVGTPCVDVNECVDHLDLCSNGASCTNTNGSYYCVNTKPADHVFYQISWSHGKFVPENSSMIENKTLIRKRCPIPQVKDGKFVIYPFESLFLLDDEIAVYCLESLKRIGLKCINASGNAVWNISDSEINCLPQYFCRPPMRNKYIQYSPQKQTYFLNERVNFTCQNGRTLIGPPLLTCVIQQYQDPSASTSNIISYFSDFYGTPPTCQIIRCAAIKSAFPLEVTVIPPSDGEEFEEGTIVMFKCLRGSLSGTTAMQCISAGSGTVRWNDTTIPNCSQAFCQVPKTDELEPVNPQVSPGDAIFFTCVQPNYQLSDSFPRYCSSESSTVSFSTDLVTVSREALAFQSSLPTPTSVVHGICIEEANKETTVSLGNSFLLFCNLKSSCHYAQVLFTHVETGSTLDSHCLENKCFAVLNEVQPNHHGTYMCQVLDKDNVVLDSFLSRVQVLKTSEGGRPWQKIIDNAQPVKEYIFESKTNSKHWDKSMHWNFENNSWVYRAFSSAKNHLITPMIRVESESGVVNVEAADLLGNCEIEVSYFTANYFITTVPEGKFKSIFKLTAKNNAASKTIKIVYSILWLMLKATGCREANVRKIEISRMNCPQVQVGLTIYPTTTTSEIDILVLGSCVAYSNQRSVKPQLVCSNNGKWRFANDHRPADACFCREGLIFQDNSCVKTGPVCYECKPGSISSCQNTVARHCNINEVCMTVMHRFNGQVVVEKKCSAECFQKMKNQNACQQGLESCTMCCNRDYCNISPFISRPATEKVSLSSALPECIDRQPMQLKCLQNLNVKRHHYAFSEPIFIPWPEVVDNDPNFRIIPNLKITSEPFVFTGNEPQIHWTALDKHNQISECVTNVIYEDLEKPEVFCPDTFIDSRFGTTSEWVDLRIPLIKTRDISAVQLVFSPNNGTAVKLSKPVLVNVTAVDSAGNLAQCQFWYMAVVADCPLWMINVDEFLCTQAENVTICYRRNPCQTRELPFDYKALVCIPGDGWRYVQDTISTNRLSQAALMHHSPVCLENQPSNITLSVSFILSNLQSACAGDFGSSMSKELDRFLGKRCAAISWVFASQTNVANTVTLNFTTSNHDTNMVLSCISDVTQSLAKELPHPQLSCAPIIRSHSITYHVYCSPGWGANTNLKCEKCPIGYYSDAEICLPCPRGTFSNVPGTAKCLICGFGKSTLNEAAESEDECIPVCGIGYYSSTGLAPCSPVPIGSYQDNFGQSSFHRCPPNMTTEKPASKSFNDCKLTCPPGTYSSTGVFPCTKCPKGFYQEFPGLTSCEKCPSDTTTLEFGSTTRFHCIAFSCTFFGCKNNGQCRNHECDCPLGFAGFDCGIILNLCNSAYCLNNGTCIVSSTRNHCICPSGFMGDRCEINLLKNFDKPIVAAEANICQQNINFCENGMCVDAKECTCNADYVLNTQNGMCLLNKDRSSFQYCMHNGVIENSAIETCSCSGTSPPSFGIQCQIIGECSSSLNCSGTCLFFHTDEAISSICVYNTSSSCSMDCGPGTLQHVGQDCYCKCPPNHYGENCEVSVNPCYQNDIYYCYNGAQCNNQTCDCPSTWKGDQCQGPSSGQQCTKQCLNGGSCVNLNISTTICNCKAGFTGSSCETIIDACKNLPNNDYSICNTGNCTSSPGYTDEHVNCSCRPPWSGPRCMDFMDPCQQNSSYCVHGKCIYNFETEKIECICDPYYKGAQCTERISYCPQNSRKICSNHGNCVDTGTGYRCECDLGYFGDNCESQDPCAGMDCVHGSCAHNKKTNVTTCICDLGFEGPTCNQSMKFCASHKFNAYCNYNGECVDYGNAGYCNCFMNATGIRCSKPKDRNYNILFTGVPANFSIKSISYPISALQSFTLCSWVRYNDQNQGNAGFTRYSRFANSDVAFLSLVADSGSVLMEMTGVTINFENGKRLAYNQTLLDGWHHICLQTPTENDDYRLFVDAFPVLIPQDYKIGSIGNSNGNFSVVLGSQNKAASFNGEISYVEVYNTAINGSSIFNMVYECSNWTSNSENDPNRIISWNQFDSVPYGAVGIVMTLPGVCYYYSCSVGSDTCTADKDKSPPRVINCPDDQFLFTDSQFKTVDFNATAELMFQDDNLIVDFRSNYRSGQVFQIGQYRVIFIATDAGGNSASCEFLVTIAPRTNVEYVNPDSNYTYFTTLQLSGKDKQLAQEYGYVNCKDENHIVSNNNASFYVKDVMGRWNRFTDVYGSSFQVPECNAAEKPVQKLHGYLYVNSQNSTCTDAVHHFIDLMNGTKLCIDNQCSNLNISCLNESGRTKRDTGSAVSLSFDFVVGTTWLPLETVVLNQLENDSIFKVAETVSSPLACNSYQVRFQNETRVACTAISRGYFYNSKTNQSEPCPLNQYKSVAGNEECLPCPDGTMTGGVGSTRKEDCFKICDPGSYYSFIINDCSACPIGTYNPDHGKLQCRPCPEGKGTNGNTGIDNVSGCVNCRSGTELSLKGTCEECPIGTYKKDSAYCVSCMRGFTTSGVGKIAPAECNVVYCPPGTTKNPSSPEMSETTGNVLSVCSQCDLGFFQPEYNQTLCLACENGKTTKRRGAIDASECTSDIPCSVSNSKPCEERGMTCDCADNAVCRCILIPVANNQSWWIILVICFFIIATVITIVVIIWKKQLIANCWPRNPPDWMLKCFPKWLQEILKTDLSEMRADRLRRSANNSFVDIPAAEFELQENKEDSVSLPSILNVEATEAETALFDEHEALTDIRDGLRDVSTPPPQALVPPVVPKPFRLQPPPQTTKPPIPPNQNFHMNVLSSQMSRSNNIEHYQKNNSTEIRATSFSSKDMTSITVSQEHPHGPPASRFIPHARNQMHSQLLQQELRSPLEQLPFQNVTPLASASLHRQSSNSSETYHYETDNAIVSARMLPGMTDYFSATTELAKGMTSARSITSTTLRTNGSIYSHKTTVDSSQISQSDPQESTDVDSDPEAFYS